MSEDKEKIRDIHKSFILECEKRISSNSDNYDKNILTLSSGCLTISILMINNLVGSNGISFTILIYLSWVSFAVAIALTMISFMVSNKAILKEMQKAERYYTYRNEDAYGEKNTWAKANGYINIGSGACFILAIIFLILFGSINLKNKETQHIETTQKGITMNDKKTLPCKLAMDGMPPPLMQRAKLNDGATVPKMQTIPKEEKQENPNTPKDKK